MYYTRMKQVIYYLLGDRNLKKGDKSFNLIIKVFTSFYTWNTILDSIFLGWENHNYKDIQVYTNIIHALLEYLHHSNDM